MACGDGTLSHCVAVTISQTEELQAAGDCIFRGLNKQPTEAMRAGGDVTCADVFSSQLQEVVLDLGVSDAPLGRAVAACGNGTPAHHCGSLWAVPPAQLGSHQPHNGWCSLGLFHGLHAPCQEGLKAAALTSPSLQHGLVAGTPSNTLLVLV